MTFLQEVRARLDEAQMREVRLARGDISASARQVSNTVADTLVVDELVDGRTAISSPFFWSRILDQGRGTVFAPEGKALVWFTDPLLDDPRLQGDWFRSEAQARASRLNVSGEQFKQWVADGTIIVAQSAAPVPASMFLEEGTRRTRGQTGMKKAITNELKAVVRDTIRKEIKSLDLSMRF